MEELLERGFDEKCLYPWGGGGLAVPGKEGIWMGAAGAQRASPSRCEDHIVFSNTLRIVVMVAPDFIIFRIYKLLD